MAGVGGLLLAEGDGGQHFGVEAECDEFLADRQGALVAERAVVFLGASFVAVTFDAEGLALKFGLHAAGDFLQLADFARLDVRLVEFEMNRLGGEFFTIFFPITKSIAISLGYRFRSVSAGDWRRVSIASWRERDAGRRSR